MNMDDVASANITQPKYGTAKQMECFLWDQLLMFRRNVDRDQEKRDHIRLLAIKRTGKVEVAPGIYRKANEKELGVE